MKAKWIIRGLKFAVLATLGFAAFGFVAMYLWNLLMPAIFGVRLITFWQTVGLMFLARLLFGRFPGRPGGMPWRRRLMERWEQMTPEQREKFREGMRHRCGQPHAPAAQPNA